MISLTVTQFFAGFAIALILGAFGGMGWGYAAGRSALDPPKRGGPTRRGNGSPAPLTHVDPSPTTPVYRLHTPFVRA